MSMTLTAKTAEQRSFWSALCPDLHIEAGTPPPAAALGDPKAHLAMLRVEGYMQADRAYTPATVDPLRAAIGRLHGEGIPLPFLFVFDEIWALFRSARDLLRVVLGDGYRALPDFWVWHVPPQDGAMGWGPHRDRVQPTLERDNSPRTLTVWMALSDATTLNGCIHVLPAHLDERFKRRVWDGDDNNIVHNPQDIRALPAPAGSLLAWNQAILHWGGRASRLAHAARTSAAFEFQRGDCPAFNRPLLDPSQTPGFEQRLGLIGKQALQYQHMYPLKPAVADIARSLQGRFLPGSLLQA